MDRPEPPMADAALAPHGPESGPMLAPQTAVGIAGVVFGWVVFHVYPLPVVTIKPTPATRRQRQE